MTPGFVRIENMPAIRWQPEPDGAAAHHVLLERLRHVVGGTFLQSPTELTLVRQGNLGEFIAYCIGSICCGLEPHVFTANAHRPLAAISRDGIDLVWIHFAPRPADDTMLLQEVKTTCTADCRVADGLSADFARLFGSDPLLTLATRIREIKVQLELQLGRPDLAKRLTRFIQPAPRYLPPMTAIPTLVFDDTKASLGTAEARLLAVRQTMLTQGWEATAIQYWLIHLDDLHSRLRRLCTGNA